MSDDSMRAKARATFGKEFMAAAAPQGYAKNGAVALQQRANARPIPTYKVGGVVKKDPYGGDRTPSTQIPKPRPSVEGPDIKAGKMKPRTVPGADQKLKAAQDRAKALGLKSGGAAKKGKAGVAIMIAIGKTKPVKKAEGGLLEAIGLRKKKPVDNMESLKASLTSGGESGMKAIRDDMASAARESIAQKTAPKASEPAAGKQSFGTAFKAARESGAKDFSWGGKKFTTEVAGEKKSAPRLPDRKAVKTAAPARKVAEKPLPTAPGPDIVVVGRRPAAAKAATPSPKRESGWDRLVARNVASKAEFEGKQKSASVERARKKAEEASAETKRAGREAKRMGAGSYKPAGQFVVAPIKRAAGGKVMPERIMARAESGMKKGGKVKTSSDTARKLATEMGGMKCGGKPGKYAVGGAGKVRKGQAPIKKAQGGAAKVRKGMMSQSGDIQQAVKPKKGIGGIM